MERSIIRLVFLIPLALASGAAHAIEYYLRADVVTVNMPDGTPVTMWGFAPNDPLLPPAPAQVPGPRLTVPPGDTTLTIHLSNNLPMLNGEQVPVSIVIPGLPSAAQPVYFPADAQGRLRVRSFAPEAMPGADVTYTWSVAPGTYLYHSGTHPQVQVQMGLYGMVTQDFGVNEAYSGVTYDTETVLLFSEIDTALHQAVATDTYGPGKAMTSTVNYAPKYFLINGAPYTGSSSPLNAGLVGQRTLVRMVNAGLETHVPMTQEIYLRTLAEDGKRLPYGHEQYATFLPAGKTLDALLVPNVAGDHPIYDRRLRLTNAAATGGGMLAFLQVSNNPNAPTAVADTFTLDEDTPLTVVAPGLLGNDTDPTLDTLSAAVLSQPSHGSLTLNADGSFTYTPTLNYSGADSFTYQASDGVNASNSALVSLTVTPVNDAPTAADDTAATASDQPVTIAVLANDTDVDGDTLTIATVSPSLLNATIIVNPDQTLTYTPPAGVGGMDTFTYTVSDGLAESAIATVTVTIADNAAPIAGADSAAVAEDTAVTIAVLANDSDPENATLSVVGVTPGSMGATVAVNPDGTVTYTPALNFNGTETFTYQVSDGALTTNGLVTVTVMPVNDAPVAVADLVAVNRPGTFTLAAPGVLANDIDPDGDALTAGQRGTVATGTLTIQADGGLSYTTPFDWVGTQSAPYAVSDGTSESMTTATLVKEIAVKEAVFKNEGGNKPARWVIKGISAAPGSLLTIYARATLDVNAVIGTTTVASTGRFEFRDNNASVFPDSSLRISIKSSTGAEFLDVPVTLEGIVPAAAAPAAVNMRLLDTVTVDVVQPAGRSVELSGTAAPGSTVTLSLNNAVIGTADVNADGTWRYVSTDLTLDATGILRVDSSAGGSIERRVDGAAR